MSHKKVKTTALFEEQKLDGGRFMLFHGYLLAREFSSAQKEHLFVRNKAGLFDISHMGEIRVQGKGALPLLEKTLTNQVASLKKNQAQYNLMCNEKGGVLDDLLLYCLEPEKDYLLCVNTACVEKDFNWLKKHNCFKAVLKNESDQWASLAIQGPMALDVLTEVFRSQKIQPLSFPLKDMKKNQCQWLSFMNQPLLLSATGYTGEKGFEVFLSPQAGPALWRKILEVGEGLVCPAGLLARDTLRLESRYPLYGQELSEDIDPYSAKLSWAVKNRKNFIGSKALSQVKILRKRVAFKLKSPGRVPRTGNRILAGGQAIGVVSSGAFSPTLCAMIGMGYVPAQVAEKSSVEDGEEIQIEIQGDLYSAVIVPRFLP